MSKGLVFVTKNVNKLKEVKNIFSNRVHVISLNEIGYSDMIRETSSSVEGNALLKVRTIYQKYKLDCFADDTALEIKSLNYKPGVYSARYGGEPINCKANIKRVLKELEGKVNNYARFKTVIALIFNGEEFLFDGIVDGEIIKEERGIFGFGYDSIFVPKGHTLTFAEMGKQTKNTISHRAKALWKLENFLFTQQNIY